MHNNTISRSINNPVCHLGRVSYVWICLVVREGLILLRDRRKCVCLMSEASMFSSSSAKRAAWRGKIKETKQKHFSGIPTPSAKKHLSFYRSRKSEDLYVLVTSLQRFSRSAPEKSPVFAARSSKHTSAATGIDFVHTFRTADRA